MSATGHDKLRGNLNLDLGMMAANANRAGGKNSHRVCIDGSKQGMIDIRGANLAGSSSSDDQVDDDDS